MSQLVEFYKENGQEAYYQEMGRLGLTQDEAWIALLIELGLITGDVFDDDNQPPTEEEIAEALGE